MLGTTLDCTDTTNKLCTVSGRYNLKNSYYYLYNGRAFYSMTPSHFYAEYVNGSMYYITYQGMANTGQLVSRAIRPVININQNVTITAGDGSASSPFEITLSNN